MWVCWPGSALLSLSPFVPALSSLCLPFPPYPLPALPLPAHCCPCTPPPHTHTQAGNGVRKAVEEMVDVVYDPVLNCYYDAKTGQYYELKS